MTTRATLDLFAAPIATDPGLAETLPSAEIAEGLSAARTMNALIAEAIDTLGVNLDGQITVEDVMAISDWIRADGTRLDTYLTAYGSSVDGVETGFQLVHDDGGTLVVEGEELVDTALAILYQIGLGHVEGSILDIDGDESEDLVDVAAWLNLAVNGTSTFEGGETDDTVRAEDSSEELEPVHGSYNMGGGRDRVIAGRGNDTVRAGTDDDRIFGRDGDDDIDGESGDDRLYGQDGHDNMRGGLGNDVMFGGRGNDNLSGDDGDDRMRGGDGDDGMQGGAGQDVMRGEAGDDDIEGGAGNDWLNGDAGNDTMRGDDGTDRLTGGEGDDSLSGGADNDRLIGGNGFDTLEGGTGHDRLIGGEGDDSMIGGDGHDRLIGGGGNDEMQGDAGWDRLFGGDGNDLMSGGDGRDILIAGDGADTLDGGTGADVFRLDGADDMVDVLIFNTGDSSAAAMDTVYDFAIGEDLIDLTAFGTLGFLGAAAFDGTAAVRFEDGLLEVDADGDMAADLVVHLHDVTDLTAGDFIFA